MYNANAYILRRVNNSQRKNQIRLTVSLDFIDNPSGKLMSFRHGTQMAAAGSSGRRGIIVRSFALGCEGKLRRSRIRAPTVGSSLGEFRTKTCRSNDVVCRTEVDARTGVNYSNFHRRLLITCNDFSGSIDRCENPLLRAALDFSERGGVYIFYLTTLFYKINPGARDMVTKLNLTNILLLIGVVGFTNIARGGCIEINGMSYCGPGECVEVNGMAYCSPHEFGHAIVTNGRAFCGPGRCTVTNGRAYCSQYAEGGIIVVNGRAYTGPGACVEASGAASCSAQPGGTCEIINAIAVCQGGSQTDLANLGQACVMGQLQ